MFVIFEMLLFTFEKMTLKINDFYCVSILWQAQNKSLRIQK